MLLVKTYVDDEYYSINSKKAEEAEVWSQLCANIMYFGNYHYKYILLCTLLKLLRTTNTFQIQESEPD